MAEKQKIPGRVTWKLVSTGLYCACDPADIVRLRVMVVACLGEPSLPSSRPCLLETPRYFFLRTRAFKRGPSLTLRCGSNTVRRPLVLIVKSNLVPRRAKDDGGKHLMKDTIDPGDPRGRVSGRGLIRHRRGELVEKRFFFFHFICT